MKLLSAIILSISTSLVGFLFPEFEMSQPIQDQETTSLPTSIADSVNGYQIYWVEVSEIGKLWLYNNLNQKISAKQAFETYQCSLIINGGFYSPEEKPIGWFHNHEGEQSVPQKNSLFDGYIWVSKNDTFEITKTKKNPAETRIGLQSGPILYYQQQPTQLDLNQDKYARRSFAAKTTFNTVIFGLVVDESNTNSGPLLSQMPEIINQFATQNQITIQSAINLDGGSASAFLTPNIKLSEIKPVGNYFCVTQ